MRTALRNRHQKAAFRPGEARVSRSQVAELLGLARSGDVEERLVAAKYLCPCHVRGRAEPIWQTVLGLMADGDPRVRFAAWHTLEDGGVPARTACRSGWKARSKERLTRRCARWPCW
ncbi:MAG TPA: hypothetical protein VHS81_15380 [Caulobacteraceae bacterium]|nr:hypothetical protein [Caulobacteraceae bacterium]